MAHAVQPDHVPHEQLRMEAPRQKTHSDKYVSAFVTGDATVEMQFRNPVLPKSADHYKVGIDELTVNLGNLSMLEYGENDVIFRVIRRGNDQGDQSADFLVPDGPLGDVDKWRNALEFKVDRPYLTILEIMERCREIATAVGTFISREGLAGNIWTENAAAGQYVAEHFRISLSANGQMVFSANRIFWANFAIEVPQQKYRQIIFKDATKRYLSLHPLNGREVEVPFTEVAPGVLQSAVFANPIWGGGPDVGDITDTTELEFFASGNVLNTLDRRVTLEVGCSLPVKNSPLYDHGQEAPDFVLGRYMFHSPYTMQNVVPSAFAIAPTIVVPQLGTCTLQGSGDRVVYHHLQPQQKIQVLRLKLWARVRTYSEAKQSWGMKTIVCPVDSIDYWHVRLHFIEK
jgi:hypothetical protein